MRVLHITTHAFGGAGEAALRVHNGLLRRDVDSRLFCLSKKCDEPAVEAFGRSGFLYDLLFRLKHKLKSKLNVVNKDYYFFDSGVYAIESFRGLEGVIQRFEPDRVILYWVSGFISPRVIGELCSQRNISVYWYLTDMAPLTGGCHYAWDCDGYERSCGKCPALGARRENDISSTTLQAKRHYISNSPLKILSPNKFMTEQVRKSAVMSGQLVREIPFGVDSSFFSLGDRKSFRAELGLPSERSIIFFGASDLREKRKGFAYLKDALIEYVGRSGTRPLLCLAGDGPSVDLDLNVETISFGKVTYDVLHKLYGAADVVAIPSVEDSGPLMTSEVLMTGTPIVAFKIGTAVDLVTKGVGYVANLRDVRDFAYGLDSILSLKPLEYEQLSSRCREFALQRYEENVVITKLMESLAEG